MIEDTPVKMWASVCDVKAWREISNLCSLPFLFHHLTLMPDVHGGVGMPIGAVLATKNVVIPNAVGVDIGCGMCAVKSSLRVEDLPQETLRKVIMRNIRKRIPVGMEHHKKAQDETLMPQEFDIEQTTVVKRQYVAATKQIGTLGGGNHFIELQRDEEGFIWVMLHSGSRNLGKQVCDYYNKLARQLNERWFSSVNPEMELSFLPVKSPEFHQYWAEMQYCVSFALASRSLMMQRIMEILQDAYPDITFEPIINIAHNYAAWENHFGVEPFLIEDNVRLYYTAALAPRYAVRTGYRLQAVEFPALHAVIPQNAPMKLIYSFASGSLMQTVNILGTIAESFPFSSSSASFR